ncbi:hypothetical protein KDU71_02490 [Carboxylicivirga sediminis]|uniref:Uncharacterized protein n=1 Tax=Carboxylicivirga sediminis TaxID=2006564 RepID=A0A941F1C5_9BACT|nr:hypothetical protein [Carboxylicivirga sediminis]MBR8534413.1 hypothetical protein [Carboxylicivirga sediminis]
MGTLQQQPPRNYSKIDENRLETFIEEINEVAQNTGVSLETALKAREILEIERRNDLFVANGDIHDEQMGGFGDLLENLTNAISELQNNDD